MLANNLERDLVLARRLVKEAGEIALNFRAKGLEIENKLDGSIVTSGDLAVNYLLKKRLREERPDDGWQSEESIDDGSRLKHLRVWIADPIDGTRDYAYGGTAWCVGLALLIDGAVAVAALYQPSSQTLYSAAAGLGATCNGRSLHVGTCLGVSGMKVITTEHERRWLKPAGAQLEPSRDRPFLLRLALVASGEIDAVVSGSPKHDWDVASGALLVKEAGGLITNRAGGVLNFNQSDARQLGIVAANLVCHDEIMKFGVQL